jgi:hypothetical protein
MRKRIAKPDGLAALKKESDRGLDEMIRRWRALPPGRRTNFLRAL